MTRSLKSGRPPILSASTATTLPAPSPSLSVSSRHTRTLIRRHHVLQKRLAGAKRDQNELLTKELEAELAATGGLKAYQLASTVGQSAERGGDSSRVLVEWLKFEIEARRRRRLRHRDDDGQSGHDDARGKTKSTPAESDDATTTRTNPKSNPSGPPPPLRILEVGALTTTNALNVPGVTCVKRIDLRSSGPGIEEADFMTFPTPDPGDAYDILSLSLVLNYVPDAKGRGEMLKRTTEFFRQTNGAEEEEEDEDDGDEEDGDFENGETNDRTTSGRAGRRRLLPSLFLVLPAPILHNSRYMTPDHLTAMLASLGYQHLQTKTTHKLHYSLWRYDRQQRANWIKQGQPTAFAKKEINPGGGHNNFCVVLDDT